MARVYETMCSQTENLAIFRIPLGFMVGKVKHVQIAIATRLALVVSNAFFRQAVAHSIVPVNKDKNIYKPIGLEVRG